MQLLEIENLVKGYRTPDGRVHTIIDVPAFQMEAGEQVALQGESGTGKTTFLNLIAGILKADEGQVRIEGRNLTGATESMRDRIRAESIGYVFQTFNLLQGYTAYENVLLGMMFGRGPEPEYARELLNRVGLADRMDYQPGQLSVGQQQRVALARALANHPRLVLADEPTGNLDRRLADEAMTLIRETCREREAALLLVSHDRSILEQFDRIEELTEINRAAGQVSASDDAPEEE